MRERITTISDNGASPQAAATLYPGEVMHARLKPFGHRFSYQVFSLLIDIDRLQEAARMAACFSVDGVNLCSFHQADHVERADEGLRDYADRLLVEAGVERPQRILLLCYPRILGYVFNPISVYFCYDGMGELTALIYAVRNTFGQRHAYVAPLLPGQLTEAGVRQERAKLLHVSPFVGMDARYHFRVLPPGKAVRIRIHETEAREPLLSATFCGKARELTTANLIANLLKFPVMTWKIVAGIHWEALKLWLKGARFHRSPPPPETASFGDAAALDAGE